MEEGNPKSTNKKAGKESRDRQLKCKNGIQTPLINMQERNPGSTNKEKNPWA
jgi:hypothetical protein